MHSLLSEKSKLIFIRTGIPLQLNLDKGSEIGQQVAIQEIARCVIVTFEVNSY